MRRLMTVVAIAVLASAAVTPVFAMTVDDVLQLLGSNVGEQVILDQMKAEDASFDLSTAAIVDLKKAGASDDLIRAMINSPSGNGDQDDKSQKGNWTDQYYAGPSSSYANFYYDPFGYYLYSWPAYFTYYYPFYWRDLGFYYAGWWNSSWCGWGPSTRFYWNHYHCGPYYSGGRNVAWNGREGRYGWDRSIGGGRDNRSQGGIRGSRGGRSLNAPGVSPNGHEDSGVRSPNGSHGVYDRDRSRSLDRRTTDRGAARNPWNPPSGPSRSRPSRYSPPPPSTPSAATAPARPSETAPQRSDPPTGHRSGWRR
jgi:hypothetical protein